QVKASIESTLPFKDSTIYIKKPASSSIPSPLSARLKAYSYDETDCFAGKHRRNASIFALARSQCWSIYGLPITPHDMAARVDRRKGNSSARKSWTTAQGHGFQSHASAFFPADRGRNILRFAFPMDNNRLGRCELSCRYGSRLRTSIENDAKPGKVKRSKKQRKMK
ncbi:MAG: hypothetical protein LQ350_008743, partial [Teloschistes chrysophthalmus]